MDRQGYRPAKKSLSRPPAAGVRAGYAPSSSSRSRTKTADKAAGSKAPPHARPPYPSYAGVPPSAGRRPKKKAGWLIYPFALLLIAGLSLAGYYYHISSLVTPYDNTFCHGVYIDGIDMGGLTGPEGVNIVQNHAANRQQAWSVQLTFRGQNVAVLTSEMLGMEIRINEILSEAWTLGHQGNMFERKAAQDALRADNRHFYTAIPDATNTAVIDSILLDIRTSVYKEAVDARIVSFDAAAEEPFVYQQEVTGRMLDPQPIKERIFEMISVMESGEIEIVPTQIPPSITVADLRAQTSLRATAITEISKQSTENRTNNIRVAFESISGTQIKPGGRFSFNGIVGVRDKKRFYEAIEYANGTEQMGYGGGVCQASTTIYLAALKAGLEIVKREPHSDSVSYTVYGQDATVSSVKGHEIDFQFKNNTAGMLYICSAVQPDPKNKNQYICRVRIYGQEMDGVSYKLDSQTIQKLSIPSEPLLEKDTDRAYVTYTDEKKLKSRGKEGYVVDTYLCTIINNVETSRKLITHDTYPAKPDRYWVGTLRR